MRGGNPGAGAGGDGGNDGGFQIPTFVDGEAGACEKTWHQLPNDANKLIREACRRGRGREGSASPGSDGRGRRDDRSFPSLFALRSSLDAGAGHDPESMGANDHHNAVEALLDIIKDGYANCTTNTDLVDQVHEFYERELRQNYPQHLPVWSKRSIHNYIFHDAPAAEVMERQSTECIRAVFQCIEYLRTQLVYSDDDGKTLKPDHRNMKMLADMCKVHTALLGSSKARNK